MSATNGEHMLQSIFDVPISDKGQNEPFSFFPLAKPLQQAIDYFP